MAEPTGQIARALVEAVKQESSEIVAAARQGRRTVADARHHLTLLNAQLDAALAYLIARDQSKAERPPVHTAGVRYRLRIPRLPAGARRVAVGLIALAAAVVAFASGWWTMQPARAGGGTRPDAITTAPESLPAAGAVNAPVEPGPVGTTAPSIPANQDPLLLAAEQWLDAYYRQDQGRLASLASAAVRVSDERSPNERLPSGLSVQRTLEGARVQIYGSTAIVTARMVETAGAPGSTGSPATVAFISQMWSRQAGGWQLTEVRIVSADAVSRAFRR